MTSAAPLEILAVDVASPGGEVLGLDLPVPRPGSARTFGFDVRGWVLGSRRRARHISFTVDGTPLWQVPVARAWGGVAEHYPDVPGADRPGFRAALSSLPLPREFALEVRVVLGEGGDTASAWLAAIRGRRAPLRGEDDPRFQPLMVTGFSRTGSNLFLRMLGAHPEIVAYRPFFHEPRVSTYWIDVLRELTEPASIRRQITPRANLAQRGWWLDTGALSPAPLDDEGLEADLAAGSLQPLVRLCQGRIDAAYGVLAARADRPEASLFAEKHLPGHVPTMLWDLYPGAREVFLVRDFRDMVASMFRADAKWGGEPRFGRAVATDHEQFVRGLRPFAQDLQGSWERRRDSAHLVRYEDLITEPEQTVTALVRYLGVDAGTGVTRAMVDSLAMRDEGSEIYRTTASPAASIGLWREELGPAVKATCEEVFAPVLELFGYAAG